MRIVLPVLAAAMLAACVPDAPRQGISLLRNPTVTMSATSRFDAARFAGCWVTREGYEDDWRLVAFDFQPPKAGKQGAWQEVIATRGGLIKNTANVRLDIPGVFFLDYVGQRRASAHVVVLWVDEGFRTAAISTRDGGSAVIVDRNVTGGEDRIAAAKTVMQQNGFDTSKLRIVGP